MSKCFYKKCLSEASCEIIFLRRYVGQSHLIEKYVELRTYCLAHLLSHIDKFNQPLHNHQFVRSIASITVDLHKEGRNET